jgi:hypothetical protein
MDGSAATTDLSPLPAEQVVDPPFARETVILSRLELLELTSQRNYYKAQHERALARETELKQLLEQERAKVRDLNQRPYGKQSERTGHREAFSAELSASPARSQGKQPGSRGHGRTSRPHLPVGEEILDLAEHEKCCPYCGLSHGDPGKTEGSEVVEIEVRPYVHKVRRKRHPPLPSIGSQEGGAQDG